MDRAFQDPRTLLAVDVLVFLSAQSYCCSPDAVHSSRVLVRCSDITDPCVTSAVQARRRPQPSRHAQGADRSGAGGRGFSLHGAAPDKHGPAQINMADNGAQTENNILRADGFGPCVCKGSGIVI